MTKKTLAPLLIRSSVLAMGVAMVALGATSVSSQSFQGEPIVRAGIATIDQAPNSTTVTINSSYSGSAVVDWTPNDTGTGGGSINFQPNGTLMTFVADNGGEFAVLNRIFAADPSRAIAFNGTIRGVTNSGTGGTVYFYSPSGIILGGSASIDVGRLGLSTAPVQYTSTPSNLTTDGLFAANGRVVYDQALQAASEIVISPGALITAPNAGSSYVALFAPVIRQNGTIDAAGSTALVAASAGTLTWNNGLFDVQVALGTSGDAGGVAIEHGGATGGSTAGSPTDVRRVYMVSVPRNTAITTLVSAGSQLGFDIAGAAVVQGNIVVLTSGYDLQGGAITSTAATGSTGGADIVVTDASATSRLSIFARRDASVTATTGLSAFAESLFVTAGRNAAVQATGSGSNFGQIDVANELTVAADVQGSSVSVFGGSALLSASNGGIVNVFGQATVSANAVQVQTSFAGLAQGGSAIADAADGGSIHVGALAIRAEGRGLEGSINGTGAGGAAQLFVSGGDSSITVDNLLSISGQGYGGQWSDIGVVGSNGGTGTGGRAEVVVGFGANNRLTVGGSTILNAGGQGGYAINANSGNGVGGIATIGADQGAILSLADVTISANGSSGKGPGSFVIGSATGGDASLALTDGTAQVTVSGALTIEAQGYYANGPVPLISGGGGVTQGGNAALSATAGSLSVDGLTSVTADAMAAPGASFPDVGLGGNATGGVAAISATGNGQLAFDGGISFSAYAYAGLAVTGGRSGDAVGGNATMTTDDFGVITASDVTGRADVRGGNLSYANSGSATANNVAMGSSGFGSIAISGSTYLSANASSLGTGSSTPGTITGSNARGGIVSIYGLGNGSVTIDSNTTLSAYGQGGSVSSSVGVAIGGTGTGGSASIAAGDTATITLNGTTSIDASAFGGGAFNNSGGGTAGVATGGQASVGTTAPGATFRFNAPNGLLFIQANGTGGDGNGLVAGATGTGGVAGLSATGGTTDILGQVFVNAQASGGSSVAGGGAGIGGTAYVFASGGSTLNLDGRAGDSQAAQLNASGSGGNASGGADGGAGTGGAVRIESNGATITFRGLSAASAPLVDVRANGTGGGSIIGDGGDGTGGSWLVEVQSGGAITVDGSLSLSSIATGGLGFNGGNAIGNTLGNSRIHAMGGLIDVTGLTTILTSAQGGDALGMMGAGGNAQGGSSAVFAESDPGQTDDSAITLAALSANADATGGMGGDSTGDSMSYPSPVAGGVGGNARAGSIDLTISSQGNYSAGPNGFLTIGDATIQERAFGGAGGAGGSNSDIGGAGADGGAGGNATGGQQTMLGALNGSTGGGTSTTGGVQFGNVTIDASVRGGNGGAAGNGGPGQPAGPMNMPPAIPAGQSGIGGHGGDGVATSGVNGTLYAEGQTVTLASLNYNVSGQGGDAGAGGGTAGNGTSGGFNIIMNSRATTGQRGKITASSIIVTGDATGGNGDFPGLGFYAAGYDIINANPGISITNSDLDVGLLSISFSGMLADPSFSLQPLRVDLVNAKINANLPGSSFILNLAGDVRITKDAASSFAASYLQVTGSSIMGSLLATSGSGDLSADTIYMQSSGDILLDGNLNATSGISLFAFGTINAANLNSDGSVSLSANQVTANNVRAGGQASITSQGGDTVLHDLDVTGPLTLQSLFGGDIRVNTVASRDSVNFASAGAVNVTGTIDAGASVNVRADGAITLAGAVTAGIVNPSATTGALYDIGVYGTGSIQAANLTARDRVLMTAGLDGAAATTITVGQVTAGTDVMMLAHGGLSFAGIASTGDAQRYVVLGDSAPLGALPNSAFDLSAYFDPASAALGGSQTISGGAVSGGNILFGGSSVTVGALTAQGEIYGKAGSFTAGNLSAADDVHLFVGQAVQFGNVQAGGQIQIDNSLSGGSSAIQFGTAQAGKGVYVAGNGLIQTGAITAGDFVYMTSDRIVINGAVTAGITNPYTGVFANPFIYVYANSDLRAQDMRALSGIALAVSNGSLSAGALTAGADVAILNNGPVAITSATAGNRILFANYSLNDLLGPGDLAPTSNPSIPFYRLDQVFAAAPAVLTGDVTVGGALDAGGNIVFANSGSFSAGRVRSLGGFINGLSGSMTLGDVSAVAATGTIVLSATTAITGGNVDAGGAITARVPGTITLGTIRSANSWVRLGVGSASNAARSVTTGGIVAAQGVGITALDAIRVASIQSGDAVMLTNLPGNGGAGTITVDGAISAGIVNAYTGSDARPVVALASATGLVAHDIQAAGEIKLYVRNGAIAAGNLTSGRNVEILGNSAISTGSVNAGSNGVIAIADTSMLGLLPTGSSGSVLTTAGLPDQDFAPIYAAAPVAFAGPLTTGALSGGAIQFATTGTASLGNVNATALSGSAAGLAAGTVTAAGALQLTSTGDLQIDALTGGGDVSLFAGRDVQIAGDIAASDSLVIRATRAVAIGGIASAATRNPASVAGLLNHAIGISAGGDIGFGGLEAAGDIFLSSGGGIAGARPTLVVTGGIAAGGNAVLLARGDVSVQAVTVGSTGRLIIADNSMAPLAGSLTGAFDLAPILAAAPVTLQGNISIGAPLTLADLRLAATGRITLSDVTVTGAIQMTAGQLNGGIFSAGGTMQFGSVGAVVLGDVNARGGLTGTGGSIVLGNLSSGGAVDLTSTTSLRTGTIAGPQVALTAGTTATLGAITANNAVRVRAGGDVALGAVTAGTSITAEATGGMVTLSGNLGAPAITLTSSDITIGSGVRVNAGLAGLVTVTSTNISGMRIGDGTTGQGYLLDATEFTAINSGSVVFNAPDIAGLAADLRIGTVAITGPLAGSTIDAPNGTVTFFTGNASTGVASGGIKVTGEIRARGFRPTNALVFSTGLFQMDADTGLIQILGQGTALDGAIFFNAPRIQIAQQSILDKLLVDPLYAGRGTDINTPLATARPAGIVRARSIELGEANQVLMQNTGTADLPAGFVVVTSGLLTRSTTPALGSVDLIINGQLTTEDGLFVGRDVLRLLVDDDNRPYFTPDSSINGCFANLSNCLDAPAIDGDVTDQFLQGDNLLVIQTPQVGSEPPAESAHEEESDEDRRRREEAEREAERSPVPPPTPIINTRPLDPVIDVDEPVAGSGNPALIGTGSPIGKGRDQ